MISFYYVLAAIIDSLISIGGRGRQKGFPMATRRHNLALLQCWLSHTRPSLTNEIIYRMRIRLSCRLLHLNLLLSLRLWKVLEFLRNSFMNIHICSAADCELNISPHNSNNVIGQTKSHLGCFACQAFCRCCCCCCCDWLPERLSSYTITHPTYPLTNSHNQ